MNKKIALFFLLITPMISANRKTTVPLKKINWTPGKVATVTVSTIIGAGVGCIIGAIAASNPRDRKDLVPIIIISTVTFGGLGGLGAYNVLQMCENNPSASDNNAEKSTTTQ
jgi:hypothetical protein